MAWHGIKSLIRDSRGAIAVEFCMIAPVMIVIAFASIHFGIMIGISHSLTQISADAARYAMVGENAQERKQLVSEYMMSRISGYTLVMESKLSHETKEDKGNLIVEIAYDFAYMPEVPFLAVAYTKPDVLTAFASARVQ